ncbi:MAG: clostripain-related cysteine peptidase [Acutalibacteraceae bacterium]
MKRNKNKLVCLMLVIAYAVLLFGCSPDNTNNLGQNNSSNENNRRVSSVLSFDDDFTLLIYMCGSSLESKNGSASDDITELLSADIPDKVNIVLETGGAERWKKHGISSEKLQRYKVSCGKLELLEEIRLACMGDSEVLKSFVDWGTKKFPAKKTALILWDHGGGFLQGICRDELYNNDWLTVQEFQDALSESEFSYAFDFIGLDACYMANYETALAVSKYTDYMIASEINEPTDGWNYKTLAQSLGGGDEKNTILKGFEEANDGGEYSLSVIDLSKLDKIKSVLMQCKDKGADSLTSALSFVEAISSSYFLYDLGKIARYLGVECDFSGVISVVSSGPENAGGISFCCPVDDEEQLEEYLHIGNDPEYNEFLKNFCK